VLAWGSLSSTAARYPGSEGVACSKIIKNILFQGNLCYYAIAEKIGFKDKNFEGFFPGKEVQKTILGHR
jgi:hypothetical protein